MLLEYCASMDTFSIFLPTQTLSKQLLGLADRGRKHKTHLLKTPQLSNEQCNANLDKLFKIQNQ